MGWFSRKPQVKPLEIKPLEWAEPQSYPSHSMGSGPMPGQRMREDATSVASNRAKAEELNERAQRAEYELENLKAANATPPKRSLLGHVGNAAMGIVNSPLLWMAPMLIPQGQPEQQQSSSSEPANNQELEQALAQAQIIAMVNGGMGGLR